MIESSFATGVDHVTIASLTFPVHRPVGNPCGDLRLLVCDGGQGNYEILAGRLEFSSFIVGAPLHEIALADGNVVLGLREGCLEEVVIHRLTPAVNALIDDPPPGTPIPAADALRSIRHVWVNLLDSPQLDAILHNHEARRASFHFPHGGDQKVPWVVVLSRMQVAWITV